MGGGRGDRVLQPKGKINVQELSEPHWHNPFKITQSNILHTSSNCLPNKLISPSSEFLSKTGHPGWGGGGGGGEREKMKRKYSAAEYLTSSSQPKTQIVNQKY